MAKRESSAQLLDEFAYRLLTSETDSKVDLRTLLTRLERLDSLSPFLRDIGQHIEAAQDLVSAGLPQLAERVARAGLELEPGSTSLQYLMALSLARTGARARAAQFATTLLKSLEPGEALFVEANALRGRLFKDQALRTETGAQRDQWFRLGAEAYGEAARSKTSHFATINAASMRLMCGDVAEAQRLARDADRMARAEVDLGTHDYWTVATMGEAAIILEHASAAADYYAEALRRAHDRRGDVASMHRQLKMLSRVCDVPETLLSATSVDPVLLYTGHRADPIDGKFKRLGRIEEQEIIGSVREYLQALRPSVVIGSAASGVDTIVLEEAARLGCERHIWLPLGVEDFIDSSVADGGPAWVERFRRVLADATRVVIIPTETVEHDASPYVYLREIMLGAGILEADRLAASVRGLAILDPDSPAMPGGAGDTAARWRDADLSFHTIAIQSPNEPYRSSPEESDSRMLRAMLFSDMVGYSAMSEPNIRAFPKYFLGLVRNLLDEKPGEVEFSNTWGDGLFLGFERWESAASFALDLRERVLNTDWAAHGLPARTSIRMGMHGGPIFREWDPVLNRENYFGSHVVRAARIEPITAPGAIWLTEEYACLLAATQCKDMACEYLGHVPLAKHYGTSALYALERGSNWLNQPNA